MDADPVEIRVLGCLIEKQRTTPDAYPLSLNSLRLACNQSTSRDPVVDYDESTIRAGLERLSRRGWVRLASGPGSRAAKYRHLFGEAMSLDDAEMAVLAVLMLRGPQTAAEISQRSERLYTFAPGEVDETLERLAGRELVARSARRPGERGERYTQLLGSDASSAEEPEPREAEPSFSSSLEERVARLEKEVAELRSQLLNETNTGSVPFS
ncbi:MAG TPA: YceH family protein [Gaiellaceae bacterium]|nr:YceH family protein [Gaiellaceae bacterium]